MLRCFLVSALLFGSIFVFVVPPFQVADEFNHFYRAWQVSDGVLLGVRTTDNRLGGDLPVSVTKITQSFRSLPFQPNNQIKSSTIFYNLTIPLDAQNRQFTDFSNTAMYAPTAYLPQVLAISIGKLLTMRPLSIFYFSRFLTLIFWLSIVYAAFKILPIKKNLFAALALLPSSLFINASVSGDVVTNACSFLVMALFLRLITEKKHLSQRQTLTFFSLIFFSTLIISLNKLAYFPIVLLVFLIGNAHFNGLKNKLIVASVLIFSNIAVIVFWAKTIQPNYIKFEDYNPAFRVGQQLNEKVDPSVQLSFMLHNPLFFMKIATFSLIKTFPHTLIHYVGKFGWEKNYLPIWLIFILVLLILVQAVNNKKNQVIPSEQLGFHSLQTSNGPLSIKAKFGFLSVFILMTFSFTAAMYAIWSPVGSEFIDNLGGKYFIPIYPLFFLALPSFDLSKKRILAFFVQPKVLFSTLWLSLIWSVFQVITRYYV
jgi:uncharacterized membrane protein